MKKVLSIILSFLMVFSTTLVFADSVNEEELTDFEYAKAMLAETMEINKLLMPCGLTVENLRNFPAKDQEFCEGLKQLLIEESNSRNENNGNYIDWEAIFNASNIGGVSDESKTDADMWGYAWEMAELNKQRDPNARDIYQEAKYMYLSHYIDIKSGPRYYVDPSISNDSYFSAWITNDDRNAYDLYLEQAGMADSIMQGSKAMVNLINGAASLKDIGALQKMKKSRKIIAGAATFISFADVGKGLVDNISEYCEILDQEDNPVSFVNRLKATIDLEDYNELQKTQ